MAYPRMWRGRWRVERRQIKEQPRASCERCDQRRVVAGADLALRLARSDPVGERAFGEDVVDAPADVALAHVAPRGPPGEELVVIGVQVACDVTHSLADHALEQGALFRKLPNDI